MQIDTLDEIIHQPTRTRILVYLTVHRKIPQEVDFNTLRTDLKLSDGQIATQIKHLETAGYVDVKKEFVGKKPRTTYRITDKGQVNFSNYLATLEAMLK